MVIIVGYVVVVVKEVGIIMVMSWVLLWRLNSRDNKGIGRMMILTNILIATIPIKRTKTQQKSITLYKNNNVSHRKY